MRYLFAPLILFFLHPLAAQDVVGDWKSRAEPGGVEQEFVLHIARDSKGALRGVLDLTDQFHFGLPVTNLSVANGKIRFEIPALKCNYEGDISATTIMGGLAQEDSSILIVFEKTPPVINVKPEQLTGMWMGSAGPRNARQSYILKFAYTGGTLSATVLAKPAGEQPVSDLTLRGNWLHFEIAASSLSFDGIASPPSDQILGTISQSTGLQPIILKRME
jgi:hypothetical protein